MLARSVGSSKASLDLVARRSALKKQVATFNGQAEGYIGRTSKLNHVRHVPHLDKVGNFDLDDIAFTDVADLPKTDDDKNLFPEHMPLCLPSSMPASWVAANASRTILQVEEKLWTGVCNDTLGKIRDAVALLSWQYRSNVRTAKSQRTTTRAYSGIRPTRKSLRQYSQVYIDARQALLRLGADDTIMKVYKELTSSDLAMSTAVVDPSNRHAETLSWIWRVSTVDEDPVEDVVEDVAENGKEDGKKSAKFTWRDECEPIRLVEFDLCSFPI